MSKTYINPFVEIIKKQAKKVKMVTKMLTFWLKIINFWWKINNIALF